MAPSARPSLSAVVPVYNSAGTLAPLVERLEPVLRGAADDFELILVNDGSSDRSAQVIADLARRHDWIQAVDLMRNFGQHNALLCGVRLARCELIVTIDDDLQNPPEEIPRLLAALDEEHDVVYGTPASEQHGLWRDLASRITKLALQRAMGATVARKVSAFRVFRRHLTDAFAAYKSPFVSIDVLLTWGTTRFAAVEVRHEPRTVGQSNYTFRALATHAMNMMTGFSTLPLQMASLMGFAFTLLGFALLAYVLVRTFFEGSPVQGFPFLASMGAMFSGAQMFALGILGEYLARMHSRSMDRPPYAVRPKPPGASDAS